MEIAKQLNMIRAGHISLVICCIFYLAWWSVTFNPMHSFPAMPKYILFAGIAISGIVGGILLLPMLGKLPVIRSGIPNLVIVLAGVCSYILLLFLTSHFMHRQVTTELFLIIGWSVLELCMLSSVYRAEAVSLSYAAIMAVVVILAALVSMICYLFYYNLDPVIGFYDGMVPLIIFAVVMSMQAVLIRLS